MKRTSKASKAEKLKAVEAYQEGKKTKRELREEFQCGKSTIQRWVNLYRDQGKDGLDVREKNHSYSKEIKQAAVEAYVMEGMSINEVSGKYGLSTHAVLRRWINKYNSHIELKDAIEIFIHFYNYNRIGAKQKGLTPVQYRNQALMIQ